MFREFIMNDAVKNQMLKKVYKMIHQKKTISKSELLSEINIKPSTLARMLDDLVKKNFIRESGYGISSGGRPPVLYEINANISYLIGIEISRIETKVILLNLQFKPLEIAAFPMTKKETPEVVFAKINETIDGFLEKTNLTVEDVLGIGVGTVGPINRQEGIMYNPDGFQAPGWEIVKIKEFLHQRFQLPIIVENGANTAAIAEYTYHESNYENILYCINGYGIRCGVINNGHIIHSRQGDASAYAHIIIREDGKRCVCGKKGCLAAYSSYGAMLEQYQDKGPIVKEGNHARDPMDFFMADLFDGDPVTSEIASQAAYYYGIGIANMINVLHPDLVVLHGSMIYESPLFYNETVKSLLNHIYSAEKTNIQIKKGTLGRNAVAVGAGIQVVQSYFQRS